MSQNTDGRDATFQAVTGASAKFYFAEVGQTVDNAVWTYVEGMKSLTFPVADKPEIDVTTTMSKNREFIAGLGTLPDMPVGLDFYPKNTVHRRIVKEIAPSIQSRLWKIEHDSFTIIVAAYIKGWPITGNIDSQMTADLTLKLSGEPIIEYPGSGSEIAWDSSLLGDDGTGAVTGSVVGTMTVPAEETTQFTATVTDGNTFMNNVHYSTVNVPAGLTAVVTKTSSTVATLTFTGTASNTADVTNVGLIFKDIAFDNAVASDVTGSSKNDIAIIFA